MKYQSYNGCEDVCILRGYMLCCEDRVFACEVESPRSEDRCVSQL